MTIAPWRTAEPIRRRKRRDLGPGDLLATAQRLADSANSLPGLDDPYERCWRTIVANEQLEAWVVAWPVGGAIELHDHGDSAGSGRRHPRNPERDLRAHRSRPNPFGHLNLDRNR